MQGKVLTYDPQNGTGIISSDDGNRYPFSTSDWKDDTQVRAGIGVDFVASNNQATEIYKSATHTEINSSKKLVAGLLAFFVGAFGIHKFYLGYNKQGIIMACCFLFGFILLGFPSVIMAIIALVEAIIYLTKSDADFERIYVVNKKPWF